MSKSIKIYSFADVDRSGKVRWAACELGLDIEEQRLAFHDQQKEEYLELNPYGQVPVAVFDGETWLDSNAICILLAERMPQAGLIPSSARQRAVPRARRANRTTWPWSWPPITTTTGTDGIRAACGHTR